MRDYFDHDGSQSTSAHSVNYGSWSSSKEKEFFDTKHREYFRTEYPESLFSTVIHRISRLATLSGLTIMDAGCGQGTWGSYFVKEGASVIGVDISYRPLKLAKTSSGLDVVCADAKFLPFKNGCFDMIFCGGMLHHMRPRAISLSSRDMYRVTKGRGRVLTLDPSAQCPYTTLMYNRFLFGLAKRAFGFGDLSPDERPLWPARLRETFSESGFGGVSLSFAQVLPSTITHGNTIVSRVLRRANIVLERTFLSRLGSIVCLHATK